jgi:hypothetical protein
VIIRCYLLHLYCDAENPLHVDGEFPHAYTGQNEVECKRNARADGWKITPSHQYCPKCQIKKEPK